MDSPNLSGGSLSHGGGSAQVRSNEVPEVSATTRKWLKLATDDSKASAVDNDMKAKLKSEILSSLRDLQQELDATAWMYSPDFKE